MTELWRGLIIGFVIGCFIGANVGLFCLALCQAAKEIRRDDTE